MNLNQIAKTRELNPVPSSYAGRSPSRPGKLPDLLGDRLRGVRVHANEVGQCPRVRVLLGRLRDEARVISEMRGVKVHRQEMVRNLITGMGEAVLRLECGEEGLDTLCSVLTKVGEGDLDEEDDGYYSSSDEEGVVTEDMAARGVGEAGFFSSIRQDLEQLGPS